MDIRKTESTIELDKVKEIWKSYALNDSVKKQIEVLVPYLSESELKTKIRETSESRALIEKCGRPPLASLGGIEELLNAAKRGECLFIEELLKIESALITIDRMKAYLCNGQNFQISLAYYAENIVTLNELRESIAVTIVNEAVSDNASKYLKDLRYSIAVAEDKMKEKADAAMRSNKSFMADNFSTIRNGHICIPVKKEYKNKVAGSVMDQSSTGATVFIEPAGCAKYYEELQSLRFEEENEVRRILYELTVQVDESADVIKNNIEMLEKLDFVFSKGKLSLELEACEPQISKERKIDFKDAGHPLMDKSKCVPLQFKIGNGVQGIVITGPNTGGKTVALKTVALNCMMAQLGLHVCAKEATVCMHSNFLCDIGDGQNISENLSTFSAHITNVMDILKSVNEESLVIMDELGSGTDPLEGMGIAVAILEELKKSGAFFLVTTHYPEVKNYAERAKGIINARMAFDKENLKPLYRMEIGEAGESCAFYIAQRLGMPVFMLKRAAEEAYGKEYDIQSLEDNEADAFKKEAAPRIRKEQKKKAKKQIVYKLGDSVMVYPDKKIGIVCRTADDKGVLQVQLKGKKIWINHKRVKLHVAAEELYPEDYDFSIIFDSVENRKMRHQMERKYVEGATIRYEE